MQRFVVRDVSTAREVAKAMNQAGFPAYLEIRMTTSLVVVPDDKAEASQYLMQIEPDAELVYHDE